MNKLEFTIIAEKECNISITRTPDELKSLSIDYIPNEMDKVLLAALYDNSDENTLKLGMMLSILESLKDCKTKVDQILVNSWVNKDKVAAAARLTVVFEEGDISSINGGVAITTEEYTIDELEIIKEIEDIFKHYLSEAPVMLANKLKTKIRAANS